MPHPLATPLFACATVCLLTVEIALRADPARHRGRHRGLSQGASLGVLFSCAIGVMRSPNVDLTTKIGIPGVFVYSKQSCPDLCSLSTASGAQFTGHAAGAHAPNTRVPWLSWLNPFWLAARVLFIHSHVAVVFCSLNSGTARQAAQT